MSMCEPCKEQQEKTRRGTPHENLVEIDDRRLFRGAHARRYEEQDYRCLVCSSQFTWSSNRNDLAWTLWQK